LNKVTLKSPFGGMTQWLYQRFTAFFMIVYLAIILFYFVSYSLTYESWVAFMSPLWMRLVTSIFFVFMIIHAWIGVQHVTDDYIKLYLLKVLINIIFLIFTLAQIIYLPYFLLVTFNA